MSDIPIAPPETQVNESPSASDEPWHRLSPRMIWVDIVVSALSLVPGIFALLVLDVQPSWGNMWPFLLIAVIGTTGAINDAVRWITTRYRVTQHHIERRTGLISRKYRSIQRERIRSVDIDAKLRHRLSGMRIVKIGAGQQSAALESALELDAVPRADAESLRSELVSDQAPSSTKEEAEHDELASATDTEVLQTFRPSWVRFNALNLSALAVALGSIFSAQLFLSAFGFSLIGWVFGLSVWDHLNMAFYVAFGIVFLTAFGIVLRGILYFTKYWEFELALVNGAEGQVLRTQHGLFHTRVVTRDVNRIRGVYLGEPLFWRWLKATDTQVITTGLSLWSSTAPSEILPRGPRSAARRVADTVLDEGPSPLSVTLRKHPPAALRRRLVWMTLTSVILVASTMWLAANDALPWWAVGMAAATWPLLLGCAVIAYRALGNAISGKYVVARSGFWTRMTSALQRSAVSTITVRESLLQRRLRLATVSKSTSGGWGIYEAPDMERTDAIAFADQAAPGLLEPFIETIPSETTQ